MKRIGVLTAGGDTPALNATILGAVERANQFRIEVFGLLQGFNGLLDREAPHVHLNPLFHSIPELDATRGGTILGASRDYIDARDSEAIAAAADRLSKLRIEGLICIGGDGTINGMLPIAELIPCVLAPKTIDNDLGLNYADEPNEWEREEVGGTVVHRKRPGRPFGLDEMINFVTPGYATAVYVSSQSIQRIRTTAESHRRVAIIEVMGRDCGMIALGASYGQPDVILVPESPVDPDRLAARVRALLEVQRHAVLCISEGIIDLHGNILGAVRASKDPAGNILYSGAAEAVQRLLVERIGGEGIQSAIFTRKIGHTQRGGRPVLFDRYHATQLGGQSVDLLVEGLHNCMATLQYRDGGMTLDGIPTHKLRDRWGTVHARPMPVSFYDAERFRPSAQGIEYLRAIFSNALGADDLECQRSLFEVGSLIHPYYSVNVDIAKRLRRLPFDT
jgi:6-phosphofructokinase 1